MIIINAEPFRERFESMYYQKILNENRKYRDKHGVGPYEYNGRFADRIAPYFDAGYWLGYDEWIKEEFNVTNASALNEFQFETEEEAAWFVLRYS